MQPRRLLFLRFDLENITYPGNNDLIGPALQGRFPRLLVNSHFQPVALAIYEAGEVYVDIPGLSSTIQSSC